jgi:hypothetical protein
MATSAAPDSFATQVRRHPDQVARLLLDSDPESASALVQALERMLTAEPLQRLERVWQLSASQAAALFGVSRQAYAKWRTGGVPADRRADVADLDVATQELLAHLKADRIPAAVRRSAPSLNDHSLLEVAVEEGAAAVREAVRRTFDLRRVQP